MSAFFVLYSLILLFLLFPIISSLKVILRPLGIAKSNMGGWVQSNDMAFINPDISLISFFFYHKTVLNKHQDRPE